MEEFLENGHVLCDPSSKEGKSCAWICNPGYSLVGPDHAKCTCDSALGCGWNGDVQFEPPICIKEYWFIGVSQKTSTVTSMLVTDVGNQMCW